MAETQQQQQQEAWEEALDLDDSDIASLSFLRRCTNTSTHKPNPKPFLRPHSLTSSQHKHQKQKQKQKTTTTTTPLSPIPGPAGPIQAAMRRKTTHLVNNHNNNSQNVDCISTQEYIRRVEEDSCQEFTNNPWLLALDVACNHGEGEVVPLRDVKKCGNAERIDKVVAIVKSCTPNGLGDMMLTLKDPTDTVTASVHRKVLGVGEFGRLFSVGSVLILQKVVAFSSSYASCYLNITRRNVAKVISVDCEVQDFPDESILSTPVLSKSLELPERASLVISGRTLDKFGNGQGNQTMIDLEEEMSIHLKSQMGSKQINNAINSISEKTIHIDILNSDTNAPSHHSNYREVNISSSILPHQAATVIMGRSLDNGDKRWQVREYSSAPSATENIDIRYARQGNGTQFSRSLKGNSCAMSTAGRQDTAVNDPAREHSRMSQNNGHLEKQRNKNGVGSLLEVVENIPGQDNSEKKDSLKRRELAGTTSTMSIDAEAKKQRLGLISKTSVQEWTDEQLSILDMDDI